MTVSEIACAMSHISLWVHCIAIDRPIVILEHDAVLQIPYLIHCFKNSICWLGNKNGLQQYQDGAFPLTSPPMNGETVTNLHIDTCQAYAIDPLVANNLLVSVLDRGIYAPVDIMVKSNKFCIVQTGIFNVGENTVSTIDRNNNLFQYYGVDPRQ
jgi:GR25 family glycosyltransferase involved in LPS biosynthesis